MIKISVDVNDKVSPALRAMLSGLSGPQASDLSEQGGKAARNEAKRYHRKFDQSGGWKGKQYFGPSKNDGSSFGADAAQAAAAVTIAKNTQGDVSGAQANSLTINVQNQLDALDSSLSAVIAKAAKAAKDADGAVALRNEISKGGDINSDEFKEADNAAKVAQKDAEEAKLDMEAQRVKYEEDKKAIMANADAAVSDLGKEFGDNLERSLEDVAETLKDEGKKKGDALKAKLEGTIGDLQAKAEEQGGVLSTVAQASLDKAQTDLQRLAQEQGMVISASAKNVLGEISKMLNDSIIDSNERQRMGTLIQLVKTSSESANKQVVEALEGLQNNADAVNLTLPAIMRRIREIEKVTTQNMRDANQ